MLLTLRIENFALVDRLELELGKGMTVLTGETGAGKSIILDAIDAVLGGKVTSRAVRTGADRALIEATFEIAPDLATWLKDKSIDLEDQATTIVCSREISGSQGSRNRSRINGSLVNKQQMEYVRDRLVKLTAQGQTVQIGQPPLQRQWLDSYGGTGLLEQRDRVAVAFAAYQQARQALDKRRKSEQDRLQQLDLFDYQLKDLKAANLSDPDELDQLEQERKRLGHSVELQQQSYQVYQALYQNDTGAEACADLLGTAENTLRNMVEYDAQLQPMLDLVSNALALVEQAGREINFYGESIEADPQRLQEVQERIVELKQVCRKYGPALADAIALQQRLQSDLDELMGGGQSLEELEQAEQERQAILTQECGVLTQLRLTTARELEQRLIAELKPLAMDKVQFKADISPCTPSALGADQVTFLFSPNPGEPLQPLTEIASGGEMSRFLLALQASFSQIDSVGTLVFDEIDVGVSGRVTQAIAEKLFQLSQYHQVLCVTHQPIVAAMADDHLHVSKQVIGVAESIEDIAHPNGHHLNGHHLNGHQNDYTASNPEVAPLDDQLANGRVVNGQTTGQTNGQMVDGEAVEPGDNPPSTNGSRRKKTANTAAKSPKTSSGEVRTVVRVTPLGLSQRREELAQLAGGQTAQEAIAFAESLLAQAVSLRQTYSTASPTADLATSSEPSVSRSQSKSSTKATRTKLAKKG